MNCLSVNNTFPGRNTGPKLSPGNFCDLKSLRFFGIPTLDRITLFEIINSFFFSKIRKKTIENKARNGKYAES